MPVLPLVGSIRVSPGLSNGAELRVLGLVFGGHFWVLVGDGQEVLGAVNGHSNPVPGAGFKNLRRPSFETFWKVDGRGHFGDNFVSAAGTDQPRSPPGVPSMSASYEVQALGSTGPEMPPDESLLECFRELAQDRIRTAGELLLVSASKCFQACGGGTFVRPLEEGDRCLSPADLEQALAPLMKQHGWRGPVSRLLHSLLGIEKVAASDGLQAPFHELDAERGSELSRR